MAKQFPQAVIGGVLFGTDTIPIDSIAINSKYRWPAQSRVAAPAAIQFVGEGESDISISGDANNIAHKGGMFFLDSLRGIAKNGEPIIVVVAGRNLGKFALTDISDGYSELFDDGKAIKNKWSVKLKAYKGK